MLGVKMRSPDDYAVAARVEVIVTRDRKCLLSNGSHQCIAIVAAREIVERLEATLKADLERKL